MSLLSKTIHIIVLIIAVVGAGASIGYGALTGYRIAYAKAIKNSVSELQKSLEYFYSDQDRYPSEEEFRNPQTGLIAYWNQNSLPVYQPLLSCSSDVTYRTPNQDSYSLEFCVPRAVDALNIGKNKITKNR